MDGFPCSILRAAGVSSEDRQDLLVHKSSKITTHYSAPELKNLIDAANRVCPGQRRKIDIMTILRKKLGTYRLCNQLQC